MKTIRSANIGSLLHDLVPRCSHHRVPNQTDTLTGIHSRSLGWCQATFDCITRTAEQQNLANPFPPIYDRRCLMQFSLSKLLEASILISVLLVFVILTGQRNLKVAERGREFDRLGKACLGFHSEVSAELIQQDVVVKVFEERNYPAQNISELFSYFYPGFPQRDQNRSVRRPLPALPEVLGLNRHSGKIRVHLHHWLKTSYTNLDPLLDILITSSFQSRGTDPPILLFQFRDTEVNRKIAEKLANDLSSRFDIQVQYKYLAEDNLTEEKIIELMRNRKRSTR